MLQTAENRVCSKRRHFNRPGSISLLSFFFKRVPSQDTNTNTNSFYGTELDLPLLLLLFSRSDRLAPYYSSTFLASTHNYLAGIHNYFFTIRTMTMVHHGLPLCGWYRTISFFFLSTCQQSGPVAPCPRPPMIWIMPNLVTHALIVGNFSSGRCVVCFLFFLCSDDRTMGFPDSSCLFFDLIPFVYLLS